MNLLIHGLNDSNEEIKFQSLCSILQSASEELEDFGEIPSILNPLLINRLLMEIRNSSQILVLQEDFSDIINVLKQKGNFSV